METFETHMILTARETLRPHVLKTPLVQSQPLSRLCGCRVYLKMECWHKNSMLGVKTLFWL
jgi:threonine dehydratase